MELVIFLLLTSLSVAHLRTVERVEEQQPQHDQTQRQLFSLLPDPKTVQQKPPKSDFIEDLISLKQSGDNWNIWNRRSPISSGAPCTETEFKSAFTPTKPLRVCTHAVDVVSNRIREQGHWPDCNQLVTLWKKLTSNAPPGSKHIFVDIGANIGSCTFEMLVSTDAYIIAFEPSPDNLSHLTTTLMINDESYRNRVALFPLGLATEAGSSTINSASKNRGNSVVGLVIKDGPQQEFLDPIQIPLDSLDHIFANVDFKHEFSIPLVKMDVQGFECNVIAGGKTFFRQINAFKTEFIQKWFVPQGCSKEKMDGFINELGFKYDHSVLEGHSESDMVDIVAIKKDISIS